MSTPWWAAGVIACTGALANPSANADCSDFAGFAVPTQGGELMDCEPLATVVSVRHAQVAPTEHPKPVAEALIETYAARARKAGWQRLPEGSNAVFQHADHPGHQLQIAAHGAFEGPGMAVQLIVREKRDGKRR